MENVKDDPGGGVRDECGNGGIDYSEIRAEDLSGGNTMS